jgi:formate dehydrogenase subunit gamma
MFAQSAVRFSAANISAARLLFAAIALMAAAFFYTPAQAQQINPTASAVQEEQLLNALQRGQAIEGRVTIPDQRSNALIKPAGQDWRAFHQGTMSWIAAVAIIGMLIGVAAFYLFRGRITIESGWSNMRILRFNSLERFTHWLTATTFIILALTGLNLVFGKTVLLPLFGAETFAAATQWGKYAHNYLAWPFMIGLVIMLVIWIKDNIPNSTDMTWLKAGGGLFSKGVHPPARKFNAGQKVIFWSVIIGGAALSVTGVFLLFPELAGSYANWQLNQIIHGLVSVVLIAVMIGHIYIGSLGMEGAFDAMGSGEVDYNWAKEHHSIWAEEMRAKQEVRAAGTAGVVPAE